MSDFINVTILDARGGVFYCARKNHATTWYARYVQAVNGYARTVYVSARKFSSRNYARTSAALQNSS